MLNHLGFIIGIDITLRQGARDRVPGGGFCVECGKKREKVYLRWDGVPYCVQCIEFDIASAGPYPNQLHPDAFPRETLYEAASVSADNFDSRVWRGVR